MRIALDTNILAYAEGLGDKARCKMARTLIERLPVESVLLPAQTLGELYRVLTAKAKRKASPARTAILGWADSFAVADSTCGRLSNRRWILPATTRYKSGMR